MIGVIRYADRGLRAGVDQHREQRDDEPPAVRPRVAQETPQGMLVHAFAAPFRSVPIPVPGWMRLAPAPGRLDDDVDVLVARRPAELAS